jgi:hypothetical protein
MSCQRVFLGLAVALAAAPPAFAQDDGSDVLKIEASGGGDDDAVFLGEPLRCIPLSRIRRTEVIDDSTIVFYTRRNEAYVNNLPRSCPRLKINDGFMYKVSQTRLCDTDWITVLERTGFAGSGFTCSLGVFHPANEEIVSMLKDAANDGLASSTSTVTPVELPAPDESTAAAPAAAPDNGSGAAVED